MAKKQDSGVDVSEYRIEQSMGIPVPSRFHIIDALSKTGGPATLQELCHWFDLNTEPEKRAMGARLGRLRKGGFIVKNRTDRYGLPDKMDMVCGRIQGHSKGYGFVIPDQGGEDLYLSHKQMRKVLHGDKVLAKAKGVDRRGRKMGVIVEVLHPEDREIIGHFHVDLGVGFVEPDDRRFARDISIPEASFNGATNGDIVVARIINHPIRDHHVVGEIIEVVGNNLEAGMEVEIAIRKHELPHVWPDRVLTELDAMADSYQQIRPSKSRRDLRSFNLVTIDGIDAKDFDDAVYCDQTDTGWKLIVAIADVSHYVATNSETDREAFNRGTSVYFPNRVIPMLPTLLSNGICSLKPNEDRNCMVCEMEIDHQGNVSEFSFYPGVMESKARLTYDLVKQIVIDQDQNQRNAWGHVTAVLDQLYKLSQVLRSRRMGNGCIDFELPEAKISFDSEQKIAAISSGERNDAHRLIEECMLVTNVCAAQLLQQHYADDAIYRVHQGPNADKLLELQQFLKGLGLFLGGGDQPEASDYADLLDKVAQKEDIGQVVQTVLLRSLKQAIYTTGQDGHFALSFPIYTHFTSPIRRYSDLVVHRQIKRIIGLRGYKNTGPEGISLAKIGEQCSFTERRADDASYDVIGLLKAEFMSERIGDEFQGKISGVKEFGIFVQLDEIFVDGLVHVATLGNDYFHFDSTHLQLIGERTGQKYRLGDDVRVRVVEVILEEAKINFEIVGVDSRSGSRRKSSKKGSRRNNPKRKR